MWCCKKILICHKKIGNRCFMNSILYYRGLFLFPTSACLSQPDSSVQVVGWFAAAAAVAAVKRWATVLLDHSYPSSMRDCQAYHIQLSRAPPYSTAACRTTETPQKWAFPAIALTRTWWNWFCTHCSFDYSLIRLVVQISDSDTMLNV